jgi:hypothetical protein
LFGYFPLNMTAYMFQHEGWVEWYYDGLSLFHLWLPCLLIYLVARLGYDRRALVLWTVTAWILLVVCYLWMPPPPEPVHLPGVRQPPVNINYVYGLDKTAAQTFMHPHVWFALLMAVMPVLVFLPTHWVLEKWRGERS